MGLTHIEARIANPARPRRSARLKFLVDSGAVYSVVPTPVLRRLGIKPGKVRNFILADGTEVKRSVGQALFRMKGEEGASPVIFGEDGDSILLGSISLEALGFILDPFKRELRPLPMLLAAEKITNGSSAARLVQLKGISQIRPPGSRAPADRAARLRRSGRDRSGNTLPG